MVKLGNIKEMMKTVFPGLWMEDSWMHTKCCAALHQHQHQHQHRTKNNKTSMWNTMVVTWFRLTAKLVREWIWKERAHSSFISETTFAISTWIEKWSRKRPTESRVDVDTVNEEEQEPEDCRHAVYRSWCTMCVKGRCVGKHLQVEPLEEEERERTTPMVAFHCVFLTQENSDIFAILICRDNRHGAIPHLVDLIKDLQSLRIILKDKNEPSLKVFQEATMTRSFWKPRCWICTIQHWWKRFWRRFVNNLKMMIEGKTAGGIAGLVPETSLECEPILKERDSGEVCDGYLLEDLVSIASPDSCKGSWQNQPPCWGAVACDCGTGRDWWSTSRKFMRRFGPCLALTSLWIQQARCLTHSWCRRVCHWSWNTMTLAEYTSKEQWSNSFTSDFRRRLSEARPIWQEHVWNSRCFTHRAAWLCEPHLCRVTLSVCWMTMDSNTSILKSKDAVNDREEHLNSKIQTWTILWCWIVIIESGRNTGLIRRKTESDSE